MLFFKIIFSCVDKHLFWNKTHYFRARYTDTPALCRPAYFIKCHVNRSLRNIGHIHRYLRNTILFDKPSDGLTTLECTGNPNLFTVFVSYHLTRDRITLAFFSSFFAYVKGDGIGTTGGGSVEIVVDCHKDIACSNHRTAGVCYPVIEYCRTKIGFPIGILKFICNALIFAGTTICKVAPFRTECSILVTIYRDSEFITHSFCELTCQLGTLFHGYICNRNERTYVSSTHTGVFSMVMAHIYHLSRLLYCLKSRLNNCLRGAHKGYYRTIGGSARIHIQEIDSTYFLNFGRNLANYLHIASFAEIGNAFDDFTCHYKFLILLSIR